MHPGPDAIMALKRLHPMARLGWFGKERKSEVELNPGEFALLELYPKHEVPRRIYEPGRERGPVFGESWDHDRYEPLWLANFSPEDVQTLRFVPVVRRWMTPIHRRMYDSAKERGKAYQARIEDLAGTMGEKVWFDIQHSTSSGPCSPKKFTHHEEREPIDLTNSFMPPFPAEDLHRLESTK